MSIHAKSFLQLAALFIFCLVGSTAHSALLELTSWGAQADLTNSNGAAIAYAQIDPKALPSSGTGRFDSFLHINAQNNPTEEGFNTNIKKPGLDTHDTGTYALTASTEVFDQNDNLPNGSKEAIDLRYVPNVTINNVNYLEFGLDINEPDGSGDTRYLAINELRLYSTNDPNLDTYNPDDFSLTNSAITDGSTISNLVWDMDADADPNDPSTNVDILLDYKLQNGQGSPDLVLLVASSLFNNNDYISLYMKAGMTSYDVVIGEENNNNFEEWGVKGDGGTFTNPVPLPASVWLFGSALFGLLAVSRRKLIGKES
ncbi:MAG: PEP-CTERM sorting domain-containing protein [Sedimenticola sp.]